MLLVGMILRILERRKGAFPLSRQRHTPEKIINKLREAEVELARGLGVPEVWGANITSVSSRLFTPQVATYPTSCGRISVRTQCLKASPDGSARQRPDTNGILAPHRARVLRFERGGETVSRRAVQHPGQPATRFSPAFWQRNADAVFDAFVRGLRGRVRRRY